jgi:pimeloyl-ACP methyl ester carboxylesterase/DNA-binding CsgD family transcriptional regulator
VDQQIRFCTSPDGVRLAYATCGAGPALVKAAHWFTHVELDWHSPLWRHWWTDFGRDHRIVRYDERGCGLSDRDPADLSLDAFTADLESVVDAARLGRFALLGVSQGGPTAIRYAVRHPDRVSHLVLCGAYARGRRRRDVTPQQLAEEDLLQSIVRDGWGAASPVFRQVFGSLLIPRGTEEQVGWLDELMRTSSTPEMAVRLRNAWSDEDVTDLLGRVRTPTLVMHARGDQVVPVEEARLLASGIRDARLVLLESENHVPMAGEPAWQVILRELRAFLGGSPAVPQPASIPLSPRELDVLRLVATGLTNEEIADRLFLSVRTVERHLSNAYVKLQVSGRSARAAAAAFVARREPRAPAPPRPGG